MCAWAIDLGTTNTGVARWDAQGDRPRLVELPDICRRAGGPAGGLAGRRANLRLALRFDRICLGLYNRTTSQQVEHRA